MRFEFIKRTICFMCFLLCGISCSASAGMGCKKSFRVCDDYHNDEISSKKKKFYERERKNRQVEEQ